MPERSYFEIISESSPARLTFWGDAKTADTEQSRTLSFSSIDELAEFFSQEPFRRGIKTDVPLFSRGRCVGPRKKANLEPPFLVILDVDGSEMGARECSMRLRLMGVVHLLYTTWSHGLKPGNCYRVITDMVSLTWEDLEVVTRCLFGDLELDPDDPEGPADRASWTSDVFFVPAIRTDS